MRALSTRVMNGKGLLPKPTICGYTNDWPEDRCTLCGEPAAKKSQLNKEID